MGGGVEIVAFGDADETLDWKANLNPDSLRRLNAKLEPSLADAKEGYRCQFERMGYFTVDRDSTSDQLVFNRIVTLKDSWAKAKKK